MITINNYYHTSYGSTEALRTGGLFVITILLKEDENQFPALQSNIVKDSDSLVQSHLGNQGGKREGRSTFK